MTWGTKALAATILVVFGAFGGATAQREVQPAPADIAGTPVLGTEELWIQRSFFDLADRLQDAPPSFFEFIGHAASRAASISKVSGWPDRPSSRISAIRSSASPSSNPVSSTSRSGVWIISWSSSASFC